MGRKKRKNTETPTPEHLTISEEFQHNGRWLRPGTEFSVHGVKGRCRFIRYVYNSRAEVGWVDAMSANKQFRSFYIDRIKTVHHTTRTRENSNE